MKKKGFTLVELLAVIVILAIIALIAIPKIVGIVEDARKGAAKSGSLGYIDAIEKQMARNLLDSDSSNDITDKEYTISELDNKKVKVKGDKPSEGCITVLNGKVSDYSLKIGNYVVSKKENTQEIIKNGQIRECMDISGIPDPVSLSTDSWETIQKAVKKNKLSTYKVGDTKTVDLGTLGTHTLRIANIQTPSSCSTNGFSQTACGLVLEFTDIIITRSMNATATNIGGWPALQIRSYVNNDIYNALPSDLKDKIIDTTVVSGYGSKEATNFTSTDKLYLLSRQEVLGDNDSSDTSASQTRQLDYYVGKAATNRIKKYNNTATIWWLRSARYCNQWCYENFHYIDKNGSPNSYNPTVVYGVSPAFRIG